MPETSPKDSDKVFAGSIPTLYDEVLVPLIFDPYAEDIARRTAARVPLRVLEIAAGTGVVTRRLASTLPREAAIVATDLNQPMLDRAAAVGTARPVEWQQADANSLPFADASFDAVVCQFGVMFFPDKAKAFAEARRVLRPAGAFLFNAWNRIEANEFTDVVTAELATLFPDDPPRFMARTPHGHYDIARMRADLMQGGFTQPAEVETLEKVSRAASARIAAVALCQGTPLRNEIEARAGAGRLGEITDQAEAALIRRYGRGPIEAPISAIVYTVAR